MGLVKFSAVIFKVVSFVRWSQGQVWLDYAIIVKLELTVQFSGNHNSPQNCIGQHRKTSGCFMHGIHRIIHQPASSFASETGIIHQPAFCIGDRNHPSTNFLHRRHRYTFCSRILTSLTHSWPKAFHKLVFRMSVDAVWHWWDLSNPTDKIIIELRSVGLSTTYSSTWEKYFSTNA